MKNARGSATGGDVPSPLGAPVHAAHPGAAYLATVVRAYQRGIGHLHWDEYLRTVGPHVSRAPHEESELYSFCVKHMLDRTGVCMEVAMCAELDDGVERLRNYEVARPTIYILWHCDCTVALVLALGEVS